MKTTQIRQLSPLFTTIATTLFLATFDSHAGGKGKGGGTSEPNQNPLVEMVRGDFVPADPNVPVAHAPDYFGRAYKADVDPVWEHFEATFELPEFMVRWESPYDFSIIPEGSNVLLGDNPFIITEGYDLNEDGQTDLLGASFRVSEFSEHPKPPRYQSDFEFAPLIPKVWPLGDVEPLVDESGNLYGFIVHVHAESVPLYGQKHGEILGNVAIGDLVFRLDAEGDDGVPEGPDPYPGD